MAPPPPPPSKPAPAKPPAAAGFSSTSKTPSLVDAAIKNPMFQKAATKAAFQAVSTKADDHQEGEQCDEDGHDGSEINCSEEELKQIKAWAAKLRIAMLLLATLTIITAIMNISVLSVATPGISTIFIALYLLFFGSIICCYECGLKQCTFVIVQNFGFLYNSVGRSIFFILIAVLLFEMSTMGIVVMALYLLYMCVDIYVHFSCPHYGEYMRKQHFYRRVKATGRPIEV